MIDVNWFLADAKGLERVRNDVDEDLLPPFSALTTDEEREKKAEFKEPGTYHVVANPRSFESLPEYAREEAATRKRSSMSNRSDRANNVRDANLIILQAFQPPVSKMPGLLHSDSYVGGTAPQSSWSSSSHTTTRFPGSQHSMVSAEKYQACESWQFSDKDAPLLSHYRKAVAPRLLWGNLGGGDIFEMEARKFPPVSKAPLFLRAVD